MRRSPLSAAALVLALGASLPAAAQTGTPFTGTLVPNVLGNVGKLLGADAGSYLSPAAANAVIASFAGMAPAPSPVPLAFPGTGSNQLPGLDGLPSLDGTLFTVASALNGGARPVSNDPNLQSGIRTINGSGAFPDINGTVGGYTGGGLLRNGLLGLASASPVPVPGAPTAPGVPAFPNPTSLLNLSLLPTFGVPSAPGVPTFPNPTSLLNLGLLPTFGVPSVPGAPTFPNPTSLLNLGLLPTFGVPSVPGVPMFPNPTSLLNLGLLPTSGVPSIPGAPMVPGVPALPNPTSLLNLSLLPTTPSVPTLPL